MSALREIVNGAARARKILLDHFTYRTQFAPLGASATASVSIPVQSDSDFLWIATTLTVFTAAGVYNPTPDMVISFQDNASGRQLQDAPIHAMNITGNGQWPFILPEPKIFSGNGSVLVTVTNNVAVAQGVVDLALLGSKIFYTANFDRTKLIAGVNGVTQ